MEEQKEKTVRLMEQIVTISELEKIRTELEQKKGVRLVEVSEGVYKIRIQE